MPRKPTPRPDEGKTVLQQRIATAMKVRGLNNAMLARKLEMNPQTTEKWLNGKTKHLRDVDIFMLGDALEVSPRWLIGIDDNMTPARKLDPDRLRALDLYDALEKLDRDMGTSWLADWISNGWHTVEQMSKLPSAAVPFPRR